MRTGFLALLTGAGLLLAQPALADITIAVAGPITGEYATFGDQMKRGAELAVADLNKAGGVNGEQVKLVVGDDACDPKQAVNVANDLANQGVKFVAGHFCSGSSIPASAVYVENGILQISPASTNPKLTDEAAEKGWTTVLRTCGRDDQQGKFAGEWLHANANGRAIAILQDKSAYGKGLADETKAALNAAGTTEAMYEAYNQGDKDFSALISKMKASNVGIVYVGGYHTEFGLLIRQAKEQGLNAAFLSGDAQATTELWSITGASGEGALFTFPPDPRNLESAKAVVAEFKAGGYDPEGYTLFTYAAVQAWAAAVTKAGSVDAAPVAEALRAGTWSTVLGDLGFDAKGDPKLPGYVLYEWKDGKYAEVAAK
ncbi:branched-chain amino acid ABC transporter substrate-binding protein [Zavarzinia sp. CC-PAN008]|uniref:branched-chain amino acid ABC transporter substrate-binding protein n=1 Tax=Zavarzinia sp. CC-PAN008 TaxID=3243332 RepID=UPI003F749F01